MLADSQRCFRSVNGVSKRLRCRSFDADASPKNSTVGESWVWKCMKRDRRAVMNRFAARVKRVQHCRQAVCEGDGGGREPQKLTSVATAPAPVRRSEQASDGTPHFGERARWKSLLLLERLMAHRKANVVTFPELCRMFSISNHVRFGEGVPVSGTTSRKSGVSL